MSSNSSLADSAPTAVQRASFLKSTWSTAALVTGLVLLSAYRLLAMVDVETLQAYPQWLVLTVLGIAPLLFVLIFPLATRRQDPPTRFELPSLKRLVTEAALAFCVVFGCFAVLFGVMFVVVLIWPDALEELESLETMDGLQNAMPSASIYVFLFVIATIGPVAEEFFFRGFLFNAFRKRMPFALAAVASSAIFGMAHSIAFWHSVYTGFLGLLLVLVYWWRKTIFAPIFIHVGINTAAAVAIFASMQMYAEGPVIGVFHQEGADACLIGGVAPGSPAEHAGLRPGDTIVQFGEYLVTDYSSLVEAIQLHRPGDSVVVNFVRDDMEWQTTVELKSRSEVK